MKFDFFRKKRKEIAEEAAKDFSTALSVHNNVKLNKALYGVVIALDVFATIPIIASCFAQAPIPDVATPPTPTGFGVGNNFTLYIEKVVIKL